MASTLLTLRNAVITKLGDASGEVWSATEVDRYVNEGQELLVVLSKILWTHTYLNDAQSTALATLPTDFIEADRVTWNWARIPMLTLAELRKLDSLYKTNEGPVRAYTTEEEDPTKLRKWLVPAATATADQDVNNTRLEYFKRPARMTGVNDPISVPERCAKHIVRYAMYRCLERKGPGQSPKMAAHYKGLFFDGVNRLIARRNRIQSACAAGVVGGVSAGRSHLSTPRLPWNFGHVVRWYR